MNLRVLHPSLTRRTFAVLGALVPLHARPALAQDAPKIEPIGPVSTQEPETVNPDGTLPPTPTETQSPIEVIDPQQRPAPTESPQPTTDSTSTLEATPAPEGAQYFAQTGHNLDYPYSDVWTTLGGLDVVGAPLSEVRSTGKNGESQQIFETIVLQFNPAEPEGRMVQGVKLDQATIKRNSGSGRAGDATAAGNIQQFWQSHGADLVLGNPVSQPFAARDGSIAQVFECAVIEQTKDGKVGLRRIGKEWITAQKLEGDASVVPAPPAYGETSLVTSDGGLNVRNAPSASSEIVVVLPQNASFIRVAGATGEWIPGYVDGYAGWVSASYLKADQSAKESTVSLADWKLDVWQGRSIGETNRRKNPNTSGKELGTLKDSDPVTVVGWVKGEAVVENSPVWAKLQDGSYVFARNVGRAAPVSPPALPADAPAEGKWIDVHLTQQLMTAYEGRSAVKTIPVTTGMPGWETPPGWYSILSRVENETMDSGAIGADYFYQLKNVLYTQYFSERGHALHYAWWRTPQTIGRPGSHGCVNLLLEDAKYFWDWADIGVPVIVRTV